ncbi:MAG TPA: CvpA family protein [Pirellulales bacterium]
MYTSILLIVVFVACFTSFMNSGLWSNTITLVNVLTAGLLATNYFEPLADYFESLDSSFTYVWDFLALWILFAAAMLVLRIATDYMSPLKVKFFMPIEKVGGPFMAIWVSWIVMCFTTMTLHTAPLSRNFLGGSFQSDPDGKMLFGLGPDRVWLGWVHRESRGALSRLGQLAPFDPRGEFIYRYADRRAEFEKQNGLSTDKKPAK